MQKNHEEEILINAKSKSLNELNSYINRYDIDTKLNYMKNQEKKRKHIKEMYIRLAEEFTAVAPSVNFGIVCDDNICVNTDIEMLHQILTIIVSNSIKFSGEECTVTLDAGTNEDGVLLRVSDDGPGISKKTLPHIFERFYRGDEAHTRSSGGSGLGLSIAKTLCSALGAQITGGNVKPHGALFEIQLGH